MGDERFYTADCPFCPLCGEFLEKKSRDVDSAYMKLVHPTNPCKRSGRVYYCPGIDLTPMPKEFQ